MDNRFRSRSAAEALYHFQHCSPAWREYWRARFLFWLAQPGVVA